MGIGHSFNAGACCGTARQRNVDDVGFLCAVKNHLRERVLPRASDGGGGNGGAQEVDAFAFGWSNGAFLTTRAAAEMPHLFRAIAPVSGRASH